VSHDGECRGQGECWLVVGGILVARSGNWWPGATTGGGKTAHPCYPIAWSNAKIEEKQSSSSPPLLLSMAWL